MTCCRPETGGVAICSKLAGVAGDAEQQGRAVGGVWPGAASRFGIWPGWLGSRAGVQCWGPVPVVLNSFLGLRGSGSQRGLTVPVRIAGCFLDMAVMFLNPLRHIGLLLFAVLFINV